MTVTTIPDWIPPDAWAGYVDMRKKKKAVMTERAEGLRIADLARFRDAGHDIAAILDYSTVNGYTDLYEPKGGAPTRAGAIQALGKKGQATADNAKAWLESDHSADAIKQAKRSFAELFTALADYYGAEVSQASLRLYWEGLKAYDYSAIEKAAWAHTQQPDEAGRWMPKVSDLNKMLMGRTSDQGQIAWSKVDRAVRTVGPYPDVAFDDALIHRVLQEMGGWVHMCGREEKEWPFVAKEFVTRYQAYKITGEAPAHAPYLAGLSSSQNSHSGHHQGLQVRLLGDQEAAKRVIRAALPQKINQITES